MQQNQQTPSTPSNEGSGKGKQRRSSPVPRIRRACTACHTGKTRCSEVLPCQSCLKRGLGATCAYPDPDQSDQNGGQAASASAQPSFAAPTAFSQMATMPTQYYYDYNASTSTFRPTKRPRPLTEEEAAAITRNFQRGDFYVGNSGPVRIDPRLPVRLTLGEGDHVHFTISEALM